MRLWWIRKQNIHKSIFNTWRLVFVGGPPLDNEDGLSDCLEDLWEEGAGWFQKKIVEWIKGNAVDASIFQPSYGKMFAKNDYLVEIK